MRETEDDDAREDAPERTFVLDSGLTIVFSDLTGGSFIFLGTEADRTSSRPDGEIARDLLATMAGVVDDEGSRGKLTETELQAVTDDDLARFARAFLEDAGAWEDGPDGEPPDPVHEFVAYSRQAYEKFARRMEKISGKVKKQLSGMDSFTKAMEGIKPLSKEIQSIEKALASSKLSSSQLSSLAKAMEGIKPLSRNFQSFGEVLERTKLSSSQLGSFAKAMESIKPFSREMESIGRAWEDIEIPAAKLGSFPKIAETDEPLAINRRENDDSSTPPPPHGPDSAKIAEMLRGFGKQIKEMGAAIGRIAEEVSKGVKEFEGKRKEDSNNDRLAIKIAFGALLASALALLVSAGLSIAMLVYTIRGIESSIASSEALQETLTNQDDASQQLMEDLLRVLENGNVADAQQAKALQDSLGTQSQQSHDAAQETRKSLDRLAGELRALREALEKR